MAPEYQEAFGEHAYDDAGNYIGEYQAGGFTPETEAQAAWADYVTEGEGAAEGGEAPPEGGGDLPATGPAPDRAAGPASQPAAGPASEAPIEG